MQKKLNIKEGFPFALSYLVQCAFCISIFKFLKLIRLYSNIKFTLTLFLRYYPYDFQLVHTYILLNLSSSICSSYWYFNKILNFSAINAIII